MRYPRAAKFTDGSETYAAVLYLSPVLERHGFNSVVAAIVHKLAHIYHDHKLFNSPDRYAAQEREAWQTVRSWGFDVEVRASERFYQRKKLSYKETKDIYRDAEKKALNINRRPIKVTLLDGTSSYA